MFFDFGKFYVLRDFQINGKYFETTIHGNDAPYRQCVSFKCVSRLQGDIIFRSDFKMLLTKFRNQHWTEVKDSNVFTLYDDLNSLTSDHLECFEYENCKFNPQARFRTNTSKRDFELFVNKLEINGVME